MTVEAGYEAGGRLLGSVERPTAVFCTNDLLALGMERIAVESGVRVPSQLGIVGYDDIRFASTSLVPLTTVRNPSFELGYEATKLVIDEATNTTEHSHRRLMFEPELVVRSSTGAPSRNGRGKAGRQTVLR
jgi:LacI family transcriptional regulator